MGCGMRLRLRCVSSIHTIASLPIPRDVEREEDQVCADGRSDDCSDEGEKSVGRIEPQPGTCEATSCCCRGWWRQSAAAIAALWALDPATDDQRMMRPLSAISQIDRANVAAFQNYWRTRWPSKGSDDPSVGAVQTKVGRSHE